MGMRRIRNERTDAKLLRQLGREELAVDDLPGIAADRYTALRLMSDYDWHTSTELYAQGGTEMLRRVRELRQLPGLDVESRRTGSNSNVWAYRLRKT